MTTTAQVQHPFNSLFILTTKDTWDTWKPTLISWILLCFALNKNRLYGRKGVPATNPQSFMPQGLDRVQTRSPKCRHHAANQAHRAKDERGRNQCPRSNDQPDVARLAVFSKRAI